MRRDIWKSKHCIQKSFLFFYFYILKKKEWFVVDIWCSLDHDLKRDGMTGSYIWKSKSSCPIVPTFKQEYCDRNNSNIQTQRNFHTIWSIVQQCYMKFSHNFNVTWTCHASKCLFYLKVLNERKDMININLEDVGRLGWHERIELLKGGLYQCPFTINDPWANLYT
jgi:hypothetical protein